MTSDSQSTFNETDNMQSNNINLKISRHQSSSSSIDKLDNSFNDEFQEHYEYLMDEGLIQKCQHNGSQLFQDESNSNTKVSFKEFIHQYEELKKWLRQMKSFNRNQPLVSNCCAKYSNQILHDEILKRSPRRELLNEYAYKLVKYHPHLKHNVLAKLQFINKNWRSMEFSLISQRYHNDNVTKGK
jgi:hypothetical protein